MLRRVLQFLRSTKTGSTILPVLIRCFERDASRLSERRAVVKGCDGIRPYPTLNFAAAFDDGINVVPDAPIINTAVLAQDICGCPYGQVADQNAFYAGLRAYTDAVRAVVKHAAEYR